MPLKTLCSIPSVTIQITASRYKLLSYCFISSMMGFVRLVLFAHQFELVILSSWNITMMPTHLSFDSTYPTYLNLLFYNISFITFLPLFAVWMPSSPCFYYSLHCPFISLIILWLQLQCLSPAPDCKLSGPKPTHPIYHTFPKVQKNAQCLTETSAWVYE